MQYCHEVELSMLVKRLATLCVAIFGLSFVGILPADAARAVATGSVNVRTGPGINHRIVGRLVSGERVTVIRCNRPGSWCEISRNRGRNGWVSSRYLTHRGSGSANRPWTGNSRPPANSICFYGTHGRICINR